MASKETIASEIVTRIGGNYSRWRIGITHEPAERKEYWEDKEGVSHWAQWTADSLADAQTVESYFINEKGMKGGTGGDLSEDKTTYVYVF